MMNYVEADVMSGKAKYMCVFADSMGINQQRQSRALRK
jgi:hypothetical protein